MLYLSLRDHSKRLSEATRFWLLPKYLQCCFQDNQLWSLVALTCQTARAETMRAKCSFLKNLHFTNAKERFSIPKNQNSLKFPAPDFGDVCTSIYWIHFFNTFKVRLHHAPVLRELFLAQKSCSVREQIFTSFVHRMYPHNLKYIFCWKSFAYAPSVHPKHKPDYRYYSPLHPPTPPIPCLKKLCRMWN